MKNTMRSWLWIGFLFAWGPLLRGVLLAEEAAVPQSQELPGTQPWELKEPLDVVLVRGVSAHAESELQRSGQDRRAPWLDQAADSPAGQAARDAARLQLRTLLGVPKDLAAKPRLVIHEADCSVSTAAPAWGELPGCHVRTCEWTAWAGVTGTGLIAWPRSWPPADSGKTPLVVVVPDADQSPEELFGLMPSTTVSAPLAQQLAEAGCVVLCPVLIDRRQEWSGDRDVAPVPLSHREFLYRLSFELGLHPVGFEVAKVLTGIEAVQQRLGARDWWTVLVGIGEGGLVSLSAAALDAGQIDQVALRGYFSEREEVWREPIYRNLFGQLRSFGDAELASLIAPRPLLIDSGPAPEVSSPVAEPGKRLLAAPGRIQTPQLASVQREFDKAHRYYEQAHAGDQLTLRDGSPATGVETGLADILMPSLQARCANSRLQLPVPITAYDDSACDSGSVSLRMKSQVGELVRYCQDVLDRCQHVRDARWKSLDKSSDAAFAAALEPFRDLVHSTFIGTVPRSSPAFHPRSRKVIDTSTHVGYEVLLDCDLAADFSAGETGIQAGGILLLPKDLGANERQPVVVFQHGLEGTPWHTITTDPQGEGFPSYQGVSTRLVEQGFIVYAPQNPYRGFDAFREIQRKSNPLGRSLFSYIVEQHRQSLAWLASLPWVDAERIAFYGLSYGGKTAMRVPPLLVPTAEQPGYCLSICSADYNDWIRKNASVHDRYSYLYAPEYEIYEWDMGHVANYAELSWLMFPRPFMVERGLDDGVAPDDWVAAEFARTRRPYLKLGLGDRAELEVFDGPHTIHGVGTFEFLQRHLNWPGEPEPKPR